MAALGLGRDDKLALGLGRDDRVLRRGELRLSLYGRILLAMAASTEPIDPASAQKPFFAGIDVGGTNIKVGIVDDQGSCLAYGSIPTEVEQGPDLAAQRVGKQLRQLVAGAGLNFGDIVRGGLATPGTMDIAAGVLLTPGNLPGWHHCPIRGLVSDSCDLPITFANDANAAAYGEYWQGAGQAYRSMVMFTLGTGIGGGIIAEGNLIVGVHSCGGELGHIVIDSSDEAPVNTLGIRGTVEGYCGAYAVVRRAEEALAAGDASSVRKRMDEGAELTPKLLAEEAESGDQLALDVIMTTAKYLAIGIVTAAHAIDPESIVLGGAMTFGGAGHPLGERFLDAIRSEARARMIASIRDLVTIDFATLGGDAGFVGAAGLARQDFQS